MPCIIIRFMTVIGRARGRSSHIDNLFINSRKEMLVKYFCSSTDGKTQNNAGSGSNRVRLALKVMYIGQKYAGMNYQDDRCNTIEKALFRALTTTRLIEDRKTCNYGRVSRTDVGVSAVAQVVCFDVSKEYFKWHNAFRRLQTKSNAELTESSETHQEDTVDLKDTCTDEFFLNLHAINRLLPKDIRVIAWAVVPNDFSPRVKVASKVYKMWFPKGDLDIELISKACKKFEGNHDFRNFSKLVYKSSYICDIKSATVKECKDDPRMAVFTVTGNRFLMHQIRCMMGILQMIGLKKEDPGIIDEMLDVVKNPTKPHYRKFAGSALCLHETTFEPDIKWRYTSSSYGKILSELKQNLTESLIHTAVLKGILDQLESTEVETDNGLGGRTNTVRKEDRPYKSIMLQGRGSTVEYVQKKFKKRRLLKKLIRNPDAELDSDEEQILKENPELCVEENIEIENEDLSIDETVEKIPGNST